MATKLDRSKLVRNLGRKYKLVPHLDKVIGGGDFEWTYTYESKHDDTAWHPSIHCTPSPHELYQHAINGGKDDKISTSLYKTFQVGHFWHQYLQYLIVEFLGFADNGHVEREGILGWGRGKWDRDIYPLGVSKPTATVNPVDWKWATGHADVAPCSIPEHGDYLIDIKTMKGVDFKQQKLPEWCAGKYECQVNVYMDFFDLEKALVLAVQKDSPHDFKEFEFPRNDDLIEAIYNKWELVGECVQAGIEPPEDEDFSLPLKGPVRS